MVLKSALILLSLARFLSAYQSPTCLSPNIDGSLSNKAICCLNNNNIGEESVDGTIYKYKCGYYSDSLIWQQGQYSSNANDCARKCSAQATSNTPCHAATWMANSNQPNIGTCYLSTAGFKEKPDLTGERLLLVRTDRTPMDDYQPEIDEVVKQEQENCDKIIDEDRKRYIQFTRNCRNLGPYYKEIRMDKTVKFQLFCETYPQSKNGKLDLGRTSGYEECLKECASRGKNCKSGWYDTSSGNCYGFKRKEKLIGNGTWNIGFARVP
ncbi:hypothetical protein BDV27DRAFT_139731 [Aspergillus caelatus]|uniref:Apple domain-containing protein n=1 Tax=Aspergillus caelatus TaxID=61420 RepID=A0A5N6ZIL8_9EURO|nr:uncharacterized protein BDV27DRAFT_139731 [Aspergillus caelatus]KAE8357228.1 hypothetical protein BDV27DRAFT_139731 [Aspergillus caelatus]